MKRYVFRVTGRIEVCASSKTEAEELSGTMAADFDSPELIAVLPGDCDAE